MLYRGVIKSFRDSESEKLFSQELVKRIPDDVQKKDLGVSTTTILDLIHGRRRLSVDMALELSNYLGMS